MKLKLRRFPAMITVFHAFTFALCHSAGGAILPPKLSSDIEVLDRAYPEIHIEFIEEPGIFGPDKIRELSKRWGIPVNFMFIGSPGDKFPYKIQELGEVRLII